MPHQLRAWGLSAVVAAVLIAASAWRSPPSGLRQWALIALIWVVASVALHVLLHNRWMDDLDLRSRSALARWRAARAKPGRPRRGASHAARRGVGLAWPAGGSAAGSSSARAAASGAPSPGTSEPSGRYDLTGRPPRRHHR